MIYSGYNRVMEQPIDPVQSVPRELYDDRSRMVAYLHGAAEPDRDWWAGVDLDVLAEKLAFDMAAVERAEKEIRLDQEWRDGQTYVVEEFTNNLALKKRIVARRRFGLWLDAQAVQRAMSESGQGSKDSGESAGEGEGAPGIED